MKQYSVREVLRKLKDSGYDVVRTTGGHQIWSNGERSVSVTVCHMNTCVANRIIRDYCTGDADKGRKGKKG